MKNKQIFTLLVAFALLLSACAPAASSQELAGRHWELQSLDGNEQIGTRAAVTLNFEAGGQVGGSGGCNSFGGSYQADAATGSISFSDTISTLMACMDDDVMQMEANYFVALNSAQSYQIQGDTLTISGGGHILVFQRAM